MDFVYSVLSSQQGALKKILDEEPYEKNSFSSVGFTLRESSSVGMPAGKLVLVFSCEEQEKIAKLKERLSRVERGVTEVTGGEKDAVLDAINATADQAAAGFGSLFG